MSELLIREARGVQRLLHALIVLSSDVLSELWQDIGLFIAGEARETVRDAARTAYASLIGGACSVYDADPSAEFAGIVKADFLGTVASAQGGNLASDIGRWMDEVFAFGAEEVCEEHRWSSCLLALYHDQAATRIGLAGSDFQEARRAIGEHIVGAWDRLYRLSRSTEKESLSSWDRLLLEHIAPIGSSQTGISLFDLVGDTLTRTTCRRALEDIRENLSDDGVRAVSGALDCSV